MCDIDSFNSISEAKEHLIECKECNINGGDLNGTIFSSSKSG